MTVRTTVRVPVGEETTQLLTTTISDELGVAIPGASLGSLTLTIYALDAAKTIINSRNRQSILNVNGGAVDAYGNLTMVLTPADNKIVDTVNVSVGKVEEHILLFEWTYAGTKQGRQEILLKVVNLEKVPAV